MSCVLKYGLAVERATSPTARLSRSAGAPRPVLNALKEQVMKRLAVVALASALPFTFPVRPAYGSALQRAPITERAGVIASDNWSGYVLLGKFTSVKGTFNVPSITGSGMVAQWVGIDGVDDDALIQAGIIETGGASTYAWWAISPSTTVDISWMKISPGDQVTVSIRKVQGTSWHIAIWDQATEQFFDQDFTYSGPHTSAEWVVEAPTFLGDISTVTPFGFVRFSDLAAGGRAVLWRSVWMVQDGAVQMVPSSAPSVRELMADGFVVACVAS